jgi:hypothetical protein
MRIALCNLTQILDYWAKHRLELWEKKIQDQVQVLTAEVLELSTQIKIIQNQPKFVKAIGLETVDAVKDALGKFLDKRMLDYALGLKINQILKLNEATLTEKLNTSQESLTFWSTTTPLVELQKQVEELETFYASLNLPRTTIYCEKKDLPVFTTQGGKSNWIVINEKGWELGPETPIRGRGFSGKLVGECKENFTIVDDSGNYETSSAFSAIKRLSYEKDQSQPLLIAGDREAILVGLGTDGTLICRPNDFSMIGKRSFSRVGLKSAVCVEKDDRLVVRFENDRIHTFSYEDLQRKVTVRVAAGWKDKLLGHRVGISQIYRAHKGFLYIDGRMVEVSRITRVSGSVLSVGGKNFCVNPSGQRTITDFDNIPEGLEFISAL